MPRTDTRGILYPGEGLATFDMRRRAADPRLRPFVEHYWLIDWDLRQPYEQHVVPHPAVNIVFEESGAAVHGIDLGLFSKKLEGRSRVVGVQFRPAGFHPFYLRPLSELTGRSVPLPEIFPYGQAVLAARADDETVARVDAFLLAASPRRDPAAERVAEMVTLVREDPGVVRVDDLAGRFRVTPRSLQRLFGEYVGISPKWVIRRYRIHEAAERAASAASISWADLAAELGYSDQAHFIRDFTALIGRTPTTYARELGDRAGGAVQGE